VRPSRRVPRASKSSSESRVWHRCRLRASRGHVARPRRAAVSPRLALAHMTVYRYLENTVVPTLTQALTQMCIQEPEDPIYWLAQVSPGQSPFCVLPPAQPLYSPRRRACPSHVPLLRARCCAVAGRESPDETVKGRMA